MTNSTPVTRLSFARWRFAAAVLSLSIGWTAGCLAQGEPQTQMVAMSDGVALATDVFLPDGGEEKFPTILVRTPYGKNVGKGLAKAVCAEGYALVVQDMRGRFDSQGHHAVIFGNDGLGGVHQDGHDTMNWVTSQPWSDGQIATWGGSALGIVQNMAAPNAPPALKGQVVIMAFSGQAFRLVGLP